MSKRKTLERKLDKVFSEYIRRRDTLDGELGKCITCGKWDHWKNFDCGHFITRARKLTRWNEKNANGQCKYCNRFRDGEQYKHGLSLDKKWGKGTANIMIKLSNETVKWSLHELEVMIEDYKQRIENLHS